MNITYISIGVQVILCLLGLISLLQNDIVYCTLVSCMREIDTFALIFGCISIYKIYILATAGDIYKYYHEVCYHTYVLMICILICYYVLLSNLLKTLLRTCPNEITWSSMQTYIRANKWTLLFTLLNIYTFIHILFRFKLVPDHC